MTDYIKNAKEQIENLIQKAMGEIFAEGKLAEFELPKFNVEIPADVTNGDLSTNVAMMCAKVAKTAPRKIAELILEKVCLDNTYFNDVQVAGAGFINFYFAQNWFCEVAKAVATEKENYGSTNFGGGKKVMIEFVSANPTGPMHIGNARGGAIGDCLASILQKAGFLVSKEFYINDAGNQIEKFMTSLEARYLQIFDESLPFPEDAYAGQDIIDHAQNFYKINGEKYKNTDSQERREALRDYALPLNIQKLKDDLEKYRIVYDVWFKESVLHKEDKINEIVNRLSDKGLTYQNEGAVWLKSTEFGAEKDDVLIRANGLPTYFAADIAYHYNKFAVRGFDKAIDVWGADHHGHIARLKGAMQALDIDPARLDIVLTQMVRLVKDGEVIKASKRSGKAITLVTLLEEVPIDAARFFFNLREVNSHCDFDLDLAVEESSKNPVYYVQYAHARICSIIKNLNAEGITQKELDLKDLELLNTVEEKELIKFIGTFHTVVNEAAKNYDPSKMTKYSLDLATIFHKFYSKCRVKCEDEKLMQARMYLCNDVKIVLANVLNMLKIDSPDYM